MPLFFGVTTFEYLHYYENIKNGEIKKNEDNFKIILSDDKKEILFYSWIYFGYKTNTQNKKWNSFVELKDKQLIFNQDLPDEQNFYKQDR